MTIRGEKLDAARQTRAVFVLELTKSVGSCRVSLLIENEVAHHVGRQRGELVDGAVLLVQAQAADVVVRTMKGAEI